MAALLIASCDGGAATFTPTPAVEATHPPASTFIKSELDYLDLMVPHHQLAIDMSKIALDKAHHGEITGIARDIIKEQDDEIHRMQVWRDMYYPSAPTPELGANTMLKLMPGMSVDLAALKASPNFDRDFIAAMIPHHESAIEMSQAAIQSGVLKHQEVSDFAHDVITVQQTEINRMLLWQQEWFK